MENVISEGLLQLMRLHFQYACANETVMAGVSTLIDRAQSSKAESSNVSNAFIECVNYLHAKATETNTPLTAIELEAIKFATSCFPDVSQNP